MRKIYRNVADKQLAYRKRKRIRERAERARLYPSDTVSVQLGVTEVQELKSYALQHGMSVSFVIRLLIGNLLELKHGNENERDTEWLKLGLARLQLKSMKKALKSQNPREALQSLQEGLKTTRTLL